MGRITTILFDFGGVITSSPFEAFNRMEEARGLPTDSVRRINSANPDGNAWARFERAEMDAAAFDDAFAEEADKLGVELRGSDVLTCLVGDVRPAMVDALDDLKERGFQLGCITNNVPSGKGSGMAVSEEKAAQVADIMTRFDHILESSKAGVRKPDPRIYQMMCRALNVVPEQCVYLDDLGINCKPAAAMGMKVIKVTGTTQALTALRDAIGLPEDWAEAL